MIRMPAGRESPGAPTGDRDWLRISTFRTRGLLFTTSTRGASAETVPKTIKPSKVARDGGPTNTTAVSWPFTGGRRIA
jgi:hypothetical protein